MLGSPVPLAYCACNNNYTSGRPGPGCIEGPNIFGIPRFNEALSRYVATFSFLCEQCGVEEGGAPLKSCS